MSSHGVSRLNDPKNYDPCHLLNIGHSKLKPSQSIMTTTILSTYMWEFCTKHSSVLIPEYFVACPDRFSQAIHDPIETDDSWIKGRSCETISQPSGETDWENRKIVCGMLAQVILLENINTSGYLFSVVEWGRIFISRQYMVLSWRFVPPRALVGVCFGSSARADT